MRVVIKLKLALQLPRAWWYQLRHTKPQVLTAAESIAHLLQSEDSLARFGDGEMNLMLGNSIVFQQRDCELQRRLREIASDRTSACLVCVPDVFCSPRELAARMEAADAQWWRNYLFFTRGYWYRYFGKGVVGDTNLSRFYMENRNKSACKDYIQEVQKLFRNRNLLFVEGEKSRLGMGNDFFAGAKRIRRILCPSENAFTHYQKIISTVQRHAEAGELVIAALGPTATVLCYDLARQGIRALDLGHIDIEYEWYRMGATTKVPVKNKDMREVEGAAEDAVDREYEEQILDRIEADV